MKLFKKPIFWLLLAAFLVRLWGIDYGLPQFFISDERAGVYGALKMLELKTLAPVFHQEEFKMVLPYLPVPSYLYLLILSPVLLLHYIFSGMPSLALWRENLVLDPSVIFIAARVFIVFLGVATVWVSYAVARRLSRSERVGLFAALFLALSFYHIQLSQVTRPWMPALFFMLLAWHASLGIGAKAKFREPVSPGHSRSERPGGSLRPYILSGLWIAIAVGANTAALAGLLVPMAMHFWEAPGNLRERFWSKKLWAMIAVAAAVSLLWVALYPYGLTQGETADGTPGLTLWAKFGNLLQKRFVEWLGFFGYYFRLLLTYETWLFVFGIFGAVAMFGRGGAVRSWISATTVFCIGYLSLLYLFFNIIPRGDLFLLPLLAISGAFAADALFRFSLHDQRNRVRLVLGAGLMVSVFAWPAAIAFQYGRMLSREDSRTLALGWMYENIPAGQKILADLPTLRIANTKNGIRALEAVDPAGLRVQDRILLGMPDDRYPEPSREVLNLHYVSSASPWRGKNAGFFASQGYRYFAVEYSRKNMQDLDPQSRELAAESRLIKRFGPFKPNIAGSSFAGNGERALDLSGEIATVLPWELYKFERFGKFVDIYELPRSRIAISDNPATPVQD